MSDKLCAIVGVGSGMGQALAKVFARAGFNLAMISREPKNMEPYAHQVKELGQKAWLYQADATDKDSLKQAFEQMFKEAQVPDVAIYNIATVTFEKPSELTPELISETLPLNFFGALNLTAAVLPQMRQRGSGTLLYTGGGFAIEPALDKTTHSVGKAALRNWVYSLYQELKPENIHAATVTITRLIAEGTDYDPELIATNYLKLAEQDKDHWQWEIIHRDL